MVLNAQESFRLTEPNGKIGHAELFIGKSKLMLADEYPDFGALGPNLTGGTPVALHLYVDDIDETMVLAEKQGATILKAAKDEFFGDRSGMFRDPFGHRWHIATRKETFSPEAMQKRWDEALALHHK